LFLDGVTVPGGMSRADNVCILPDGSAERRLYQRTLDENPACLASRGLKSVYELRKADGTRHLFADVDVTDTVIASFGSELISHFATWTPTSGWTYGSSIWTHTTGTTALVATGETSVVAATKYRIVVDVTQASPSSSAAGWTYTATDSGLVWKTPNGNEHIVWNNKWTHAAGGGTTALTTVADMTVIAGQTYRIIVHVTHTSGTSLSVYIGSKLAGTITATGLYEYVVPFVTDTAALRFVPTSDWAGSIDKYWPHVPNQNDAWVSVQKFIDPAGANIPSNMDTGSTHRPISHYSGGRELLYKTPVNWYPEESSQLSQSLAVYLGGIIAGVIQASGEYTYDVTAATTAALTFVPSTSWNGSVNSASVRVVTYGAASTKMKVIGGAVTGTTDYEVSWSNILTDLASGIKVLPAWTTMQDRAFRVDGTNINYYFKDAYNHHTLGVPSPTDAPVTASSATTGDLVAGTYNVYYTYVKKDGDYIVEGNPSPVSNTVITGTAIDVNVIGNSDSDITHIRIYRTLYNEEGADAYYEREVLNETDTVTITDADDTIGDGIALEYNRDMPKRAMFVMTGGSRLWLLRFPSEVGGDSMMMWSEIGSPEYFPALNYQPFDPDDGDVLMGAAMMQNNILVFKRRRTWICDVYSMQNIGGVSSIAKNILSPIIGCIASGSIQSVGIDQAIWLSAEGIMLYDGGRILNISKDRINTVINSFMANGAEYYIDSVYHSTRRQYHINFVYRGAGTKATGTITSNATNVTAGDTVTVDSKTYTFISYDLPLGTEGYVRMGTTAAESLSNLFSAINHTGVPDLIYTCAAAHPTVLGTTLTDTVLTLEARTAGTEGNAIVLGETAATLTKSAATLLGGTAADTAITSQRHFVYSMDANPDENGIPGAWTEYVYTDDDGVRFYEINFCLASDSNLMEVILIPYLVTTTGTVSYIYQTDYEPTSADDGADTEILDSDGDGVTTLINPSYSFCDSSDNVYVTTDNDIFKVTSAGVKSCIATDQELTEGIPGLIYKLEGDVASISGMALGPIDLTNSCFYVVPYVFLGGGGGSRRILKISFTGTITDIIGVATGGDWSSDLYYPVLHETSNYLFYLEYESQPPATYCVKKISAPGAGQVESIYYTLTDYSGIYYGMQIYSDDLYLLFQDTATYGNYQLLKFTTITGTAALTLIDTGIDPMTYGSCGSFLVISDTEIYVEAIATTSTIFKVSHAGSSWVASVVVSPYTKSSYGDANLQQTSGGNFYVCNYNETIKSYNSDWEPVATYSNAGLTKLRGVSRFISDENSEQVLVVCGYTSANVYKLYPGGYWEIITDTIIDDDTEPTMRGAIVNIVSNYTDLGIANDKRIKRVYLDTESQYATCGAFTLEPGYNVNIKVHEIGETSEPSGATSLRPFAHPGRQDWTYTNDQFDSTSEAWLTSRLDVGVQGKKFRYSIKVGDVPSANHGILRIRPPMVDVQVKGKY